MHHVVTIDPFIITVQFRNPGLVSLDLLNIQRESVNMLCSVRTIVFIEFFKRLHARFASHLYNEFLNGSTRRLLDHVI
jgi:hypothetical protein